MSQGQSDRESQEVYVRFVDILFAVVLAQSFVVLNSIFRDPRTNAFRLGTVFVIYALVITSWYGYHHSVSHVPIRSAFRWLIDIMLLFVYYTGFVAASELDPSNLVFTPVLLVFLGAFALYSGWDAIRIVEYWSKPEVKKFNLYTRLAESLSFTIILFAVTGFYVYVFRPQNVAGIEWGYLVGLTVLLVIYRYLKLHKRTTGP